MTGIELLKQWKERNSQVENVVLFISDALRWDFTPESVSSKGLLFKAIASGVHTAISFPSIITGLHPSRLGIYSFYQSGLTNEVSSLLNLAGYNTSLWTENCWVGYEPPISGPLYKILGHPDRIPLEELKPPFIYLEDEKGGHCPYGWSPEERQYEEWDGVGFIQDMAKQDASALREKYKEGIKRTTRVFEDRMHVIEKRDLADRTLVVFLSDHGESLGEHGGIVGHEITTPETAYVPLVLIHPDLPHKVTLESEGVVRHIDLSPTIHDLLHVQEEGEVDGVDLFAAKELSKHGVTYLEEAGRKHGIDYLIREVGVWDRDGGYIFREGMDAIRRLSRQLYKSILSNENLVAIYQRGRIRRTLVKGLKDYGEVLSWLCSSSRKWGSPSFNRNEAQVIAQRVQQLTTKAPRSIDSLLGETEEQLITTRLKSLGYVD
jgi:hypothetical protein